MTEQTIIVSSTPDAFETRVKEWLHEGWKVVPGTLVAALSGFREVFMVALEREVR